MSKWDKLISRILNLSADVRYEELEKILMSYGYEKKETKGGSSHVTFRKKGCNPITIPRHMPINKVYVELVRSVIESEVRNNEDA